MYALSSAAFALLVGIFAKKKVTFFQQKKSLEERRKLQALVLQKCAYRLVFRPRWTDTYMRTSAEQLRRNYQIYTFMHFHQRKSCTEHKDLKRPCQNT